MISTHEINCSGKQLTMLTELPEQLQILFCSENLLTRVPKLPNQLRELYCSENLLTSITDLPDQLRVLCCHSNLLTHITGLPGCLEKLYCSWNLLTTLPRIPQQTRQLFCSGNPLSYLPMSLLVSGCYVDRIDKEDLYKKGSARLIMRQIRKNRLKKWSLQWSCYPVMCPLFGCDITTIINKYM